MMLPTTGAGLVEVLDESVLVRTVGKGVTGSVSVG